VFVVDIVVDITEIKLAEEELAKSEVRFRELMEQSPQGMEILSPDGKIMQVNSAWKKLWDATDEEAEAVLEKYNMLTDPQMEQLGVAELTRKAFEGEPVTLPPIQYSAQQTVACHGRQGAVDPKPPLPGQGRSRKRRFRGEYLPGHHRPQAGRVGGPSTSRRHRAPRPRHQHGAAHRLDRARA
jgi:hypothetical protein